VTYLVAAAIVLIQTLTGAYIWALARPRAGALELIGMGFGVGSGLSTLSGVVLFERLPLLAAVLFPTLTCTLVAAGLVLLKGRALGSRKKNRRSSSPWRPGIVAIVIGIVFGGIALALNLTRYPLTWEGSISSYHGDFLFFEALSTSLATLGSSDSIFMSGEQVRYHWMVYAWTGQVAELSGAAPFETLTRVLPAASLIGSVLLTVVWTQRLSPSSWAPSLAVALLVTGGYVGATYGTILNFDSPSQQLATVWMLAAAAALWETTQSKIRSTRWAGSAFPRHPRFWLLVVIIGLLTGTTATGKASAAAVLIVGWLLVPIIGLWNRKRWWLPSLVAGLSGLFGAGALTIAYVAGSQGAGGIRLGGLLDKASSVQGLNPSTQAWGIVAGTILLILAVSFRWAGLLWLAFHRSSRLMPITIFGVGLAVAGLSALALVSEGINDTWFPLAASAPLAIISSVGIAAAATEMGLPRKHKGMAACTPFVAAALAGFVGALVVGGLWTFGPGSHLALRWLGPLAGIAIALLAAWWLRRSKFLRGTSIQRFGVMVLIVLVSMGAVARAFGIWSDRFGVQPEQGLTAAEFRPNQIAIESLDSVVTTGWSTDEVAAGRWLNVRIREGGLIATNVTFSPLVPALAGAPTFISGIHYQAPYGRSGINQRILDRERASIDFINDPTADAARELCQQGVTWLWIDPRRTTTADWQAFGQTVLESESVVLVQRNAGAC